MSAPTVIDVARCETLATRAASGDDAAWKQLVETLWPVWLQIVRKSRSMGPFARSDDHVHDVIAKLVEKLGRKKCHGLKLYWPWIAKNPDKTFEDWIRIVAANVIRDYVRAQLGEPGGPQGPKDPSVSGLLNDFAQSPLLERLGVRPPMTAAQTARQLMEFAEARLSPDQYRGLSLWLQGASFEEVGEELGIAEVDGGRKLVRASVAVLRRQFFVWAPENGPSA